MLCSATHRTWQTMFTHHTRLCPHTSERSKRSFSRKLSWSLSPMLVSWTLKVNNDFETRKIPYRNNAVWEGGIEMFMGVHLANLFPWRSLLISIKN